MQLRGDALDQHLARGVLAPLYVVASNEILLSMEACDALRLAARTAGYSEREVHSVSPRFDWQGLAASSHSLSLFAERKLIELRIPTGKPGKEGSIFLQQLGVQARGNDDIVTLITLPRPDSEMKASKWWTALQNTAVFIVIDSIERAALPAWIGSRLARQKQSAPREALTFMADRVEGNLLAAHQEIQKLGLLYPPRALSFDEVQSAVLNVARYDVFKLGEALLAGDSVRFARMLQGLQGEGEALPLVLWSVAEELRTIWRVQRALGAGQPASKVMRELRVWGVREKLLPAAAQRLSKAQLVRALRQCAVLDKLIKGLSRGALEEGMTGDAWADVLGLGMNLMTP